MVYTKYKKWLAKNLNKERYEHSIGTAECAKDLAKKFGLDEEKAYLSGLIHDCAKCKSNQDLKEVICNCNDLCDGELTNYKTYHAPAGAILAKEELGICDKEVLSATRWHTLGKIEMSDFEKCVFDLKMFGLEYKEIASLLDKSYKSVDSALQRIRGKVKKVLEEYHNK